MYRFRVAARSAIEDAGLTQTEIATAAGIDRQHFNKRLHGTGSFSCRRPPTEARAFAEATRTPKPAAMHLLFEEFDNGREAKAPRELTMPQISQFYGIVIAMFFNDHVPPHFHAYYGGDEATINIETGEIIDGKLPRRALRMVRTWARHTATNCGRTVGACASTRPAQSDRAAGLRRRR